MFCRSSRKRPPREFEKVVVTRADRLQEYALVSNQMVEQWRVVVYESFRNSLIIHNYKTEELIVEWMSLYLI